MQALILTNEYPPNVYGGAGVHVEYLTRELAKLIDVDVRTFGEQDVREGSLRVRGFPVAHDLSTAPQQLRPVLGAFSRSIGFVAEPVTADVVHCHTWYAHLGGILVKLAYGIPLVITVHSLEPLRPWKREQLGGGYDASSWVERTALEMADAVIAVSQGTKDDVLAHFDVPEERIAIIHNGIDTDEYRPQEATDALRAARHRPDRAVRAVRRADHAPEGHRPPGPRDPRSSTPGTAGRALRRRARHAGDRRRDGGGRQARPGGQPGRHLDRRDGRQADSPPAVLARRGVLLPVGLRAVRDHQPGGDGLRDRGRRKRRRAASRRWSSTARLACWCRSNPAGGESFEPRDPDAFERDLAARINELMADRAAPARMGVAGGGGRWSSSAGRRSRADRGPVRVADRPLITRVGPRAVRPTNQGTK